MNEPTTPLPPAQPQCVHFGTCGGCQYQDITYGAQFELKRNAFATLLADSGIASLPLLQFVPSPQPYGYRNRIRLRIESIDGALRVGYNIRTTTEFLPITMCPIAAPLLWSAAESLLTAAAQDADGAFWLSAATEVELFCNDDLSQLQITLLCPPRTAAVQGSLARFFTAAHALTPEFTGLSAIANDPRTGPTGRTLDAAGATGLLYRVAGEAYWVSRGSFFQVNRFLLPKLVELVCTNDHAARSGNIAWDLFAGVGLFSRILSRRFTQVTAVEASPISTSDLSAALSKLGPQHRAVNATTLDFLRTAVLDRERPDLIVLDPPRAGLGSEVCALLERIAAPEIVYVSCDPATLARDLAALQSSYRIDALSVVDLFPQTAHLESVAVLQRR